MRNKILVVGIIGLFIFMQLIASQLSDPKDLTALLFNCMVSTGKATYLLNETVRIQVTAPENTTTNLTIQDPEGYLYATLGEELGDFTHLYHPKLTGNYSVFARFYLLNESANANASFRVIPENIPDITIKTDKESYLVNETILIQIAATENTTINLTIKDPGNYLHPIPGENLGGFTYRYTPSIPGNYTVTALILIE
ncbi:MAG: hypothetical protein KAU03_04675, partial [Candidatus Altiarchaeales archaeon]|nr:hypothetical protein [Candidatus Altiarchaeales archaeon]